MYPKPWQHDMFVDHADIWQAITPFTGSDETAAFFADVIARFGDPAAGSLDIACGTGRLAPYISAASAFYIGLDLSDQLLSEAQRTAPDHARFLQADMALLGNGLVVPGVANLFRCYTSLGYFPEEEERQFLLNLKRHSPDGMVLIDTFNGDWFRAQDVITRERDLGDPPVKLSERYEYQPASRRVACRWRYVSKDDGSEIANIPFDLLSFGPRDLARLIDDTGWSIAALFSDYRLDAALGAGDVPTERLVAVLT